MSLFKKILKWVGIVVGGAFVILVIVRAFHFYNLDKTNIVVEKIHNTKLQLPDVMGENLPPDPGAEADKTVAGVDANQNGIRDDVELAVFKEYPKSAKTRAVLLQYALTLQMQMTLPIVNMATVTATVEDNESRADVCLWNLSSRSNLKKFIADINRYRDFMEKLQLNNEQRRQYRKNLYENLGSYSASHEGCDLDLSTLPN